MFCQPRLKWRHLGAVCALILTAASQSKGPFQIAAATPQLGDRPADPLAFLKQVGQRYANAAYYHIDAITEEQMDGDFSKNWSKSVTTAVFAPGKKYRFEAHTNWEWWIQVSDGNKEWLYSPATQEYKEQTAPVRGPVPYVSSGLHSFFGLTKAQESIKDLSELPSSVRQSSYTSDETLALNGKQVSCYVIDAVGKYQPGWVPDTTRLVTIWVGKEDHLIRKVRERMEGVLIVSRPQVRYISDKTTVYPAVELDMPVLPDSFFAFAPPSTAKLVQEFEPSKPVRRDTLIVGKPAPEIGLTSLDGKTIWLKSFQGKPVLLDFWATWCGPCVESMPSVKKLYSEAAKYGLILLSIDEDDDAIRAADFLSQNNEIWPNFHDDGEVVRLFPNEGIPHFVLIDSAGTVVFSKSSFDEAAIRAAIVALGPEFASVAATSTSSSANPVSNSPKNAARFR